jgi:hypothetical protein
MHLRSMRVVGVTLHESILPYDRLESATKRVTKWQRSLALRDDVPLKKIQLMGQIDALCKFDFFNRLQELWELRHGTSLQERWYCPIHDQK